MIVFAFAIATAIAFFAAPSMPLYSARDIQLVRFNVALTNMAISVKILAGVEIDNANIVGGDIHSTLVDIYYPDWNGDLQNIGYLQETKEGSEECMRKQNSSEEDHGICIADETSPLPFFSVQPLGISTSKPGIITIYLQNVTPRTYLKVITDFFFQWGSIELLVSGAAHVKTPLGLLLSVGVICKNSLDLTKHPIQIVGKSCSIERVSTGWGGLEDLAFDVRERTIAYHRETGGDIFHSEKRTNSLEDLFSTTEMILDWHDF